MTIFYQTQITLIGRFAQDALSEKMFITFNEQVPPDLADYCFLHRHGELSQNIEVGDWLVIDQHAYQITAVGNIASFNLKELGHLTICFDQAENAITSGAIHCAGEIPSLTVGSTLTFKTK
ncbi:PTS glucitol/sorbitol transporter subunit IIA [Mergibacter septicus]|uniref:PTS glucitol/sorbitol transporter subunit IIA n=1 Tax=Mergibacter septicus TaxID=221402 RepID=UPI00117941EE|nr:PTS glucitol/sorbitol transporter subunit IIA [Mergibacter septicus]AWX14509.1 PTS glucitol/sorbitol transporter subunit IIA [Mergibacter septicus]